MSAARGWGVLAAITIAALTALLLPATAQADPEPRAVEVSLPEQVDAGASFEILVVAVNQGDDARAGSISVSFPDNPDVWIIASDNPNVGESFARVIQPGETVSNRQRQKMVLTERLAESFFAFDQGGWASGGEHFLSIGVQPLAGQTEIEVRVRVAMLGFDNVVYNDPPAGLTDQQGYGVEIFHVTVGSPTPTATLKPSPTATRKPSPTASLMPSPTTVPTDTPVPTPTLEPPPVEPPTSAPTNPALEASASSTALAVAEQVAARETLDAAVPATPFSPATNTVSTVAVASAASPPASPSPQAIGSGSQGAEDASSAATSSPSSPSAVSNELLLAAGVLLILVALAIVAAMLWSRHQPRQPPAVAAARWTPPGGAPASPGLIPPVGPPSPFAATPSAGPPTPFAATPPSGPTAPFAATPPRPSSPPSDSSEGPTARMERPASFGTPPGPRSPFWGVPPSGYQILNELGRGGMATVYRAEQVSLGRQVALKVLSPHLEQDPSFAQRFQAEARLVASLDHPSIVPIFDMGTSEGSLFIAMKLVPGESLAHLLRRADGPLPLERCARIVNQVGEALDHAHARGIVHRDVKPANILVEGGDRAYLSDFGIARLLEGTRLTRTGGVMGTPEYMAPEQARGEIVDFRADLYSLGVVLFELCTGRTPFAADSGWAVLNGHVNLPPPQPRGINPHISPLVEDVILQTLAKDPAERYQSGHELAAAFAAALRNPV